MYAYQITSAMHACSVKCPSIYFIGYNSNQPSSCIKRILSEQPLHLRHFPLDTYIYEQELIIVVTIINS